ncbi:MAG: GntR family transcriptional regulator [Rhodobacteraceae bacterium]|nr:GntR family transcriptional regulator [Paracoccaceae bacterium]
MQISSSPTEALSRLATSAGAGSQTASGRILDSLRHRIISLELPPDTVLSRTDLARDYAVSQTPVRDALQKLEAEGLVEIFPQSKTVVTRIDTARMHEAHFLRRATEIEVVRMLAETADDVLIARLRSILSMQRAIADNPDEIVMFQDLDEAFHLAMMTAIGQPGLHAVLRAQSGHLNRLRRLDMPDGGKIANILDGHDRIIVALEAHDPEAAEAAIREHLSRTISRVDILRARHPDYFRN